MMNFTIEASAGSIKHCTFFTLPIKYEAGHEISRNPGKNDSKRYRDKVNFVIKVKTLKIIKLNILYLISQNQPKTHCKIISLSQLSLDEYHTKSYYHPDKSIPFCQERLKVKKDNLTKKLRIITLTACQAFY